MLQIVLLYALYGIVFVFNKEALAVAKPFFFTGARVLPAGICCYFLYRLWFNKISWSSISKKHAGYLVLLGIFNVYLTNGNETWSLQYLSAGKVAFIYNLSPFFSLLFSHYMFKEAITWKKILGIAVACISITPLLISDTDLDVVDTTTRFGFLSVAEIVMIVASAATAFGWVIMKHLMDERKDFNSYFLNATSMFVASCLCFGHSFLFETKPYITTGHEYSFLWYTMILMLLQNVFAYNFNSYLLTIHSATLVILFSFVMPIMTAIFEYFVLSQPLELEFFLCSLGVAIGLLIFYHEELADERNRDIT